MHYCIMPFVDMNAALVMHSRRVDIVHPCSPTLLEVSSVHVQQLLGATLVPVIFAVDLQQLSSFTGQSVVHVQQYLLQFYSTFSCIFYYSKSTVYLQHILLYFHSKSTVYLQHILLYFLLQQKYCISTAPFAVFSITAKVLYIYSTFCCSRTTTFYSAIQASFQIRICSHNILSDQCP